MSTLINFIVKTKNVKESEVRKALKDAGIEVFSVATVYKEEVGDASDAESEAK